ncbi:MoaD/ThiS family protein [Arsenicicoccus sp. oral taxon 190]|uniref:MoaD/ThiS family protein n=1 Tax=Arsenicicoccus sp. oral taxon 190 TaxID=1658671 RepID=UPI00067A1F8F|nr:MoaD/ThiS family protein [Arsenicicoccus sp. oral taxon 190]AKT52321.1 hypothetical protein ADJ73_15435 [Arsenicicoccus sp. oral taxon 190]
MSVTMRLPAPLQAMVQAPPEVVLDLPADASLADALDELRRRHPTVENKVRDERGALREHVNVFVDGADVKRGAGLVTVLPQGATVIVLSAVSGG